MFLVDNFHFIGVYCQFEHCDTLFAHELSRYRSAKQLWKFLDTASDILLRLDHAMFVISSLCLNRHHILSTVTVNTDVNLVNLDLSNTFDCRSQVILQWKSCNAQKQVHQPIVTYLCKQGLLIA